MVTTRYQHRIGVRSELFLTLVLDVGNPTPGELARAVADALLRVADSEGGIKVLGQLADAVIYPLDAEVDPSAIRSVDCVEIKSVQ